MLAWVMFSKSFRELYDSSVDIVFTPWLLLTAFWTLGERGFVNLLILPIFLSLFAFLNLVLVSRRNGSIHLKMLLKDQCNYKIMIMIIIDWQDGSASKPSYCSEMILEIII